MDFTRRYPHPKLQYEYFVVNWTKGYSSAELWYNKRLVIAASKTEQLLEGVKINDEILGDVEFKLEQEPYVLNVIVNGYHSSLNSKHPKNGIKSVSNWVLPGILYYLLATLVVATILFSSEYFSILDKSLLYYNLVCLGLLVAVFYLIRKVSPIFLFASLLIYIVQLILFTLTLLQSSSPHFLAVILYLGYLAFVIAMFLPARRIISYMRHKKFEYNFDSGVLDN